MFEKASRLKLRFETAVGNITTDDLWDLRLISGGTLDALAKTLSKAIKDDDDESFIVQRDGADSVLQLKFDIVKHVIEVKLSEAEAEQNKAQLKAKKERIMSILADKEDDDLKGQSTEELKELLAGL